MYIMAWDLIMDSMPRETYGTRDSRRDFVLVTEASGPCFSYGMADQDYILS